MKICLTHNCGREAYKHSNYCWRCKDERFRSASPENELKWHYYQAKHNAKKRWIEFALTFEEFKKFVSETDYIKLKGRQKLNLTIDRIDNNKGYAYENIRAITNEENARKRHYDYTDELGKKHFKTVKKVTLNEEEYPF